MESGVDSQDKTSWNGLITPIGILGAAVFLAFTVNSVLKNDGIWWQYAIAFLACLAVLQLGPLKRLTAGSQDKKVELEAKG